MPQDLTPELLAALGEKFQRPRGEIEIDYVISAVTSGGSATDLLAAFGSVTSGHAGASSTQTPYNPSYANDSNGATYSQMPAGGQGAPAPIPERWLEGDLGSPMEITYYVVKWASDFGDLSADLFQSGTGGNGRYPYVRFRYWDGVAWVEVTGSITTNDGNNPDTITFTLTSPITAQLWQIYAAGRNNGNLWPGYDIYTWGLWGVPGSTTEVTLGTASFQVATISLDRSRKMAAAQLDVLMDNEDTTRGWYTGDGVAIIPNNPIRAYAWLDDRANRVRVFTGLLDRIDEHRNFKTISLKARSRMKWLFEQEFVAIGAQDRDDPKAIRTEANGVYLGHSVNYIVEKILDRGGWPSADRVIWSGASDIVLAEYLLADRGDWASQIAGSNRLTTAANCDFWEDELGVAHFEPSPLVATSEPTADWQLAAGVNVMVLDHETDDEDLVTRVEVSGPMTSTIPAWKEVWRTSVLRYPAGSWYDPTAPSYVRVVDRVTKYLYKIKQSDRTIATKHYLGGYPLGLSGDPTDSTHYYVLNAPWRNTGTTSGNSLKEYRKSDHVLLNTYSLPNGRWTGMKTNGSHVFLTNYDDDKIYKRSMVGAAVSSYATVYGGETQTKPTGLWLNGTTMGVFFAGEGHKRFLLMSTSAIGTVTGHQSTAGTWLAGGEADTDTDIDLYATADSGSFGLTSGLVAKFTLAELITKDVSALAVDWDLEDALGIRSGIADRVHVDCPNIVGEHPYEIRLGGYAMEVIQSLAQAQDVAEAQLRLLARLRRQLDLQITGHPGIQINDVVRYQDGIAGIDLKWIVDTYRMAMALTYTQTLSVLPWEAP